LAPLPVGAIAGMPPERARLDLQALRARLSCSFRVIDWHCVKGTFTLLSITGKGTSFLGFRESLAWLKVACEAEAALVEAQSVAFGDALRGFANTQSGRLVSCMTAITTAVVAQIRVGREWVGPFRDLPKDFGALHALEAEIDPRREVLRRQRNVAAESAGTASPPSVATTSPPQVGPDNVSAKQRPWATAAPRRAPPFSVLCALHIAGVPHACGFSPFCRWLRPAVARISSRLASAWSRAEHRRSRVDAIGRARSPGRLPASLGRGRCALARP